MHGDLRHALAVGQIEHGEDVVLVAVHAAGREQAKHVQDVPARLGRLARRDQLGGPEEAAVLDGRIDAGQILIDDPAGAQVHVADLGVAHLAIRQADVAAFGVDQGVRRGGQQASPIRQFRLRQRIVGGIFTMTPAIQDQQDDGLGTRGSGRRWGHGGGSGDFRQVKIVAKRAAMAALPFTQPAHRSATGFKPWRRRRHPTP